MHRDIQLRGEKKLKIRGGMSVRVIDGRFETGSFGSCKV